MQVFLFSLLIVSVIFSLLLSLCLSFFVSSVFKNSLSSLCSFSPFFHCVFLSFFLCFFSSHAAFMDAFYRRIWLATVVGWSVTWWLACLQRWLVGGPCCGSREAKAGWRACCGSFGKAKFRFGPSIYDCSNCTLN